MNKETKINHEGVLKIGEIDIPCYVLQNGTRVISGRGMQNALKISDNADRKEEQKAGNDLARFIERKWFNSLITNAYELEHFLPIVCYKGHQKINGYEASLRRHSDSKK